ncbi:hypothetical protein EDD76_103162 [Kineothrix alysoides]|uniref:Uncharacterized protein n=1 Tax=Kineothrix alysoides TaxID=1469948 RepID=A0A4R1R3F9_9FIRM|nr:hypothetical protein [Kineothrix alysoides]TCL59971.1 hypothetical protein EDD76_103162 [Kineothrix alysoides]
MAKKKMETTVAIVDNNSTMNPPADVYSKEMITELNSHVKIIRSEMNKIEGSFSKIAFNLYWINENGAFKALGYKDVYSFAKAEFGIARGTANNFINVVERFGKRIDGHISEPIADEYKTYKSSQLIVMLGMDEKDLEKINSDMSVREMKKVKKGETEQSEGRHNNSSSDSSSDDNTVDVESKEINRTVMITFKSLDDYLKHRDSLENMISRNFTAAKKAGKEYKIEVAYTW